MKTLNGHINGHNGVTRRARIDMLEPANFKCAFLAEWGLTIDTIGQVLNMSHSQVRLRLKYAKVSTVDYRQGKNTLSQMIIKGTNRAGVPQLKEFTEQHLRTHLRQIGWKDGAIRPELSVLNSK